MHTKALGYGGAETVYEITGVKSSFRIPGGNISTFVVNTAGGPGDAFILYKLDSKKGKRQAVASTFSAFSGMKGAKGVIQVNVKILRANIYQLTPVSSLDKGEYFFANKASGTNGLTATTTDVYAFGID